MSVIAITGHRPKDLPPGYGYNDVRSALAPLYRPDALHPHGTARFITGGALGIDQWVALWCLNEGVEYEVILPFPISVMSKFWRLDSTQLLERLIAGASHFEVVGDYSYDPAMYQRRNERMVDRADKVFAFWSGKPYGGTANCIRYAQSVGKPIYQYLPQRGRYPNIGRPLDTDI